jgi:hypothetical protein
VLAPADVTFAVSWDHAGNDTPIVTFMHHFDPPSGNSNAVPLDADQMGAMVPTVENDLLVLTISVANSTSGSAFIPNADGPHSMGRIPSLTLP